MTVVEERTVSPELGADSIEKGVIAGIIATVSVLVLMLVVYGRFGVYANIALIFNVFLIIATMAAFNATLTLPGIAGFALTIGAAVGLGRASGTERVCPYVEISVGSVTLKKKKSP